VPHESSAVHAVDAEAAELATLYGELEALRAANESKDEAIHKLKREMFRKGIAPSKHSPV
jgi:cell division protein FtsB